LVEAGLLFGAGVMPEKRREAASRSSV
jgi:hypothetical protein